MNKSEAMWSTRSRVSKPSKASKASSAAGSTMTAPSAVDTSNATNHLKEHLKEQERLGTWTTEESLKQWRSALVTFTQMLWGFDLEATLQGLVGSPRAADAFVAFLDGCSALPGTEGDVGNESERMRSYCIGLGWSPEAADEAADVVAQSDRLMDLAVFRLLRSVAELQNRLDHATTREEHAAVEYAAAKLTIEYRQVLGVSLEGAAALGLPRERLAQMGSDARTVLCESPLLSAFITSPMSHPLINDLLPNSLTAFESALTLSQEARALLWSGYKLPADAAGWLVALSSVGEMLPACIVISDISLPGNPMIYVNPEFSRVTGYSKVEALGRNCKFLQGPRTEPEAVATIQNALRAGIDCHVRISNYRKSGELFSNLLMLRPVYDPSRSRCRFYLGVQLEVTRSRSGMDVRLNRLARLMALLPTTLPAPSMSPSANCVLLGSPTGLSGEAHEAQASKGLSSMAQDYVHRMNKALGSLDGGGIEPEA